MLMRYVIILQMKWFVSLFRRNNGQTSFHLQSSWDNLLKYGYKCLLLLLIILAGCAQRKAPAVLFDGTRYKFGEVKRGEEVVFTFTFKNTGTATLNIEDVYISCECVIVKDYTKSVEPGAKGRIYGIMETKDFEGDMYRAIQIKTNVPESEPVMLVIEGVILPAPRS